jgi:hypothetical protein
VELCELCHSPLEGTEKFCPSCGGNVTSTGSTVILDAMLPISLSYEAVIKVNIDNISAVKISRTSLDFHPHYLFEYNLYVERKDPSGKTHHLQKLGIDIVDAFDGTLLSKASTGEFRNLLHAIFSNKRMDNVEQDKIRERNQIMDDLRNIEPIRNHKLRLTEDYAFNIVDNKISLALAEKKVLRKIIAENTIEVSYKVKKSRGKTEVRILEIKPKLPEVKIKRKYLVYVPIWIIVMKSGDFNYNRKVLAASHTFIKDEIEVCPKHASLKIWAKQRQTFAVCDICGLALCSDHVFRADRSYYCETHRPSK